MKTIVALALSAGALWAASASSGLAQHDPYRWCAELGGGADSYTNCYFITRAQCEATVLGVGGFCRLNQFYTGPETGVDAAQPRTERKRAAPR